MKAEGANVNTLAENPNDRVGWQDCEAANRKGLDPRWHFLHER